MTTQDLDWGRGFLSQGDAVVGGLGLIVGQCGHMACILRPNDEDGNMENPPFGQNRGSMRSSRSRETGQTSQGLPTAVEGRRRKKKDRKNSTCMENRGEENTLQAELQLVYKNKCKSECVLSMYRRVCSFASEHAATRP